MTNKEKLEKIQKWQEWPFTHDLTCGDCSESLVGSIQLGQVILSCPSCPYTQTHIPSVVYGDLPGQAVS